MCHAWEEVLDWEPEDAEADESPTREADPAPTSP